VLFVLDDVTPVVLEDPVQVGVPVLDIVGAQRGGRGLPHDPGHAPAQAPGECVQQVPSDTGNPGAVADPGHTGREVTV
jgi:hypothetical protein